MKILELATIFFKKNTYFHEVMTDCILDEVEPRMNDIATIFEGTKAIFFSRDFSWLFPSTLQVCGRKS